MCLNVLRIGAIAFFPSREFRKSKPTWPKKKISGRAPALFFSENPIFFWESVLHYKIIGIFAKIIFCLTSDYLIYSYHSPLAPPCQPLFTRAGHNFFKKSGRLIT
ncbi:hypothetical protein B9T07_07290 [Limnospira fusiformis CCALA 023]|nr:hypothetical protein AP285_24805 [Arthrospira platensis YZ]KDR55306.1 hypothetical protein APPUASWS_023315 [Arthrospira platensis str. Paraca]